LNRATYFGCHQRGLKDAGNTDGDLVLKVENIVQQAIEMVGPEMSVVDRVNQDGR